MTRARAVDEQLSSMAEQLTRHNFVLTKLDSLCSTIQQHSESFDVIRSSLATQQTVMAEMMVKLQQLEKASPSSSSPLLSTSTQPSLLPLPPSNPILSLHPSSPLIPPSLHSNSSISTPQLPKIEVPFFSGDDVLGWLFQINHYFLFHQIPANQRLAITAFYMAGAARQWFQWLHSTDQLTHWDDFVQKLEL